MENKINWVIDPTHSEISFKVKHLMISNVKGVFGEFESTVTTEGEDFSSAAINVRIKSASINTGTADRDNHLRSADFFDAENFSDISLESTSLKKLSDDEFALAGDLTIRGITKPVTLDVEFGGIMNDPWGNVKAGFTVSGKINRKDWGLNWNAALEAGGVLVSDEVKINCEVEYLQVKS